MLRYMTAGESHGECLTAILEGMPAGLKISLEPIVRDLKRRMAGYGRSERMKLENDAARVLSGLLGGITIGSPITLMIQNKDASIEKLPGLTAPRPGHADLAGILKYNQKDIRIILERSSARETAIRVAVGAVCKELLVEFGIEIASHIVLIGGVDAHTRNLNFKEIKERAEKSPVRCADEAAEKLMCEEINKAKDAGDTLGGIFEVIVKNAPVGLGSHVQWDRRLDTRLAASIMSIQGVKGVEIGAGMASSAKQGSKFQDQIVYDKIKGFSRKSNNAGGIEGGISNGENIVVRAAMKPISTLKKPLPSIDIKTKKAAKAEVQRADVCAVPAAGIVGEAVAAFDIANAMCEKLGGDSIGEMKRNFDSYINEVRKF